jgi:hypothetical protein
MTIKTSIRATVKSSFTLSSATTESKSCDACAVEVLRAVADEMKNYADLMEGKHQ